MEPLKYIKALIIFMAMGWNFTMENTPAMNINTMENLCTMENLSNKIDENNIIAMNNNKTLMIKNHEILGLKHQVQGLLADVSIDGPLFDTQEILSNINIFLHILSIPFLMDNWHRTHGMLEVYHNPDYDITNNYAISTGDKMLRNTILTGKLIAGMNTLIKGGLGIYNLYQWMGDNLLNPNHFNDFDSINSMGIKQQTSTILEVGISLKHPTTYVHREFIPNLGYFWPDTFLQCNNFNICLKIPIPDLSGLSMYCDNGFTQLSIISLYETGPVDFPISNIIRFNCNESNSLIIKQTMESLVNNSNLNSMIRKYLFLKKEQEEFNISNTNYYLLKSYQSYLDGNGQLVEIESQHNFDANGNIIPPNDNIMRTYGIQYNSQITKKIYYMYHKNLLTNNITPDNTRFKLKFNFKNQDYDILDIGFIYQQNGCEINMQNCIENYFFYPSNIDASISPLPIVDYIINAIEDIKGVSGRDSSILSHNSIYEDNAQWYDITYWLNIVLASIFPLEIPTILDALSYQTTNTLMLTSKYSYIGLIIIGLIQGGISSYFTGLWGLLSIL